jgi:hypothetical protein
LDTIPAFYLSFSCTSQWLPPVLQILQSYLLHILAKSHCYKEEKLTPDRSYKEHFCKIRQKVAWVS